MFKQWLQPAKEPVLAVAIPEVVFAANQPQYNPLRVVVSETRERRVLSRWTLTPEQRELVASGADIYLELMTFGEPLQPTRMALDPITEEIKTAYEL
jgi:hypothetical protein